MHIKRTVKNWSDKFKDLVFKSTNRFRILNINNELILLNNMEWKNELQKYSCLILNKEMLLWFLVIRVDKALGIISKRYERMFFLRLKNKHNFR